MPPLLAFACTVYLLGYNHGDVARSFCRATGSLIRSVARRSLPRGTYLGVDHAHAVSLEPSKSNNLVTHMADSVDGGG